MRFTAGITADHHALRFWLGVWAPVEVAAIDWIRVSNVTTSTYKLSGLSRESLVLTLAARGEVLDLSVVSRRWFGYAPSRSGSLVLLADELRRLLPPMPVDLT